MPLKQPKKRIQRTKQAPQALEDLIRGLHHIPEGVSLINSATKLTKALATPVNVANSERLMHLLRKDIEISNIPDYIAFLKAEWGEFKVFVANNGVRGMTEPLRYTLGDLCANHKMLISLFRLYTSSNADYRQRIGVLESWERDHVKTKEDSVDDITKLKKNLLAMAKSSKSHKVQLAKAELELDRYRQAYTRAKRFASVFTAKFGGDITPDEMLDYLEEGTITESITKHPLYHLFR